MTKPSLMIILALGFGLSAACGRNEVAGPDGMAAPPARLPVFASLTVSVDNPLVISTSSQLTIKAWDQFGAPMQQPIDSSRTSFTSSSPQIARVNSHGVVTGVAVGSTHISVVATIGGFSRIAGAEVWVSSGVRPLDFPAGVYDLTAEITRFDPAWGDLTGYRYTAILTFPANGTGGRFENLHLVDAAGITSDWTGNGAIVSYVDFAGRLIDELVAENFHLGLGVPDWNSGDSHVVTGSWGCCAHISGSFTARRRQ